jgi:glycosyltransferase involved in cell wall biosynthesis
VVLICSSYLGYELLPYLRAHCPDVTFLDYLHMEDETWKNGGYPRASLNHSSGLDLTVTSSKHLKDWLAKNGARPESIEVCTTNIDTQDWNPQRFDRVALRQGLDLDGSIPVILYAGRLCQQKQPELFAQVMHELTRLPYPFVCLVAGDGEARPFVEQYLKVNGLNGVRLLGAVSSQRMRELMAISDIFFLPSQMEGISLAIYEAMAMGVVPVSADVGGQSELVTSECGILVPRGETERNDYVRALEFLLQDPEQRARMGLAARRRVSGHFRLEQMGERMVQLMQRGQERSRQTPRIRIPLDLAHEFATLVIEYTRLEQVADYIWKQRQELLAAQPVEIPLRNLVLRYWARRIRHLIRPLYRWGLRHGMLFLEPMARKSVRQVRQWIYPSNGPSTSNR